MKNTSKDRKKARDPEPEELFSVERFVEDAWERARLDPNPSNLIVAKLYEILLRASQVEDDDDADQDHHDDDDDDGGGYAPPLRAPGFAG